MKLPTFPVTVKRGNSSVKIYRTQNGKYEEFKLAFFQQGKRKFESFSDYDRALTRADEINEQVNTGDIESLSVSRRIAEEYEAARLAIAGTGSTLLEAVGQYAEAKKKLGAVSLSEAVRYFVDNNGGMECKTIAEIAKEYLAVKTSRGVCRPYIRMMTNLLAFFQDRFKCDLRSICADDLREFISASDPKCKNHKCVKKYSPKTFNNKRTMMAGFFKFAVKRKYLPITWNVMAEIDWRIEPPKAVTIYSPEEIKKLLTIIQGSKDRLRDEMLSVIALGAFAGIRTAELMRLKWENVGTGAGKNYIEIPATIAKTRQRRLIPISENLKTWLGDFSRKSGPVWPRAQMTFHKRVAAVLEAFPGWCELKRNALRHSYISYRVAETSNVSKIALEAGNSPQIIFEHYRELVTPEAAAQWFDVKPDGWADNVEKVNFAG